MTSRFLTIFLATCALAFVVTAGLAPSVGEVTYLWPDGLPAHPYFVPSQAGLLYIIVPLFATSAVVTLLAPGVFAVMTWGGAGGTWSNVLARGFLASYAGRVTVHSIAKLAGATLTPALFWSVEVTFFTFAAGALLLRWRSGGLEKPQGPLRRLWLVVLFPALVTLALLPQVFWQDLTEDGMEALEIGWSLTYHVVPRFPNDSGFMGLGIGMLAMAPPVSWFIQLIGPTEAAARLPVILYLPVVALILIGLAEHGGRRRLQPLGETLIVLVLISYVAVMAFSATYDAYAADVSAPTAFETLTLMCLSGALLGLWQGRRSLLFGFVVLGYLARPTALMFVLLLGGATVVVAKGAERRRMLQDLGLSLGACAAVVILYEKIYLHWASGGSLSYAAESVVARYQYLRFADLRRFLWVMIPGGFLPFLSLFAIRRHDLASRQLAVVLVSYFAAFFFPAFVALHHFVPVMVLPVVVFLRSVRDAPRWTLYAGLVGCLAGVGLSVPHHWHIDQSSRAIGSRMVFAVGDYNGTVDQHRVALESRSAALAIFPATWDVEDMSRVRVGAPLSFLYYSARKGVTLDQAEYAILPEAAAPPEGFFEAGRSRGAVAYVRDQETWEADRADTPLTKFGNPLFVLPRETLFRFMGAPADAYDLNLQEVPLVWRLF